MAAEAGGRDVEEESRGPEIGTEEPRQSTRIRRQTILKLCGEKCGVLASAQAQSRCMQSVIPVGLRILYVIVIDTSIYVSCIGLCQQPFMNFGHENIIIVLGEG